jgi:hypothetical protein
MGNSDVLKTDGSINVKNKSCCCAYLIWEILFVLNLFLQTFNKWFCLLVFGTLWQHICQKGPVQVFFFLFHDNTPSCTPALVVIFVQNLKLWTSPCLPDMVHCDFFVFETKYLLKRVSWLFGYLQSSVKTGVIRFLLNGVKPEDGRCWPKHVVSCC